MRIFAVIVTYNGMQHGWIEKCLESLRKSTMEITPIVIDNLSTDGTRDFVPQTFPEAIWMPQEENLGFGKANNIGIKYALEHDADYVLLLNQDATLHTDALKLMVEASDGESLLSPLHLNGDGTGLDEMFRISIKIKEDIPDGIQDIRQLPGKRYKAGEICAACWLMPVGLIRKVGGFNPLFYHYGEDNNYYQRMVYHGVDTLLVPAAKMQHDRELYGNIRVYNEKLMRRDILLIVANINFSFGKILYKLLRKIVGLYVYQWHQYRFGSFTRELIWVMCHLKSIHISRQTERHTGLSWLVH